MGYASRMVGPPVSKLEVAKFVDGSVRWRGDLKLLEPLLAQLKAEAELTESRMREAKEKANG